MQHEEIKIQIEAQWKRLAKSRAFPKENTAMEDHDEEIREKYGRECYDKVYEVAKSPSNKEEKRRKFKAVLEEF